VAKKLANHKTGIKPITIAIRPGTCAWPDSNHDACQEVFNVPSGTCIMLCDCPCHQGLPIPTWGDARYDPEALGVQDPYPPSYGPQNAVQRPLRRRKKLPHHKKGR
jgi:hypothetical protein